jgi:carboxymethylenebutenolidase
MDTTTLQITSGPGSFPCYEATPGAGDPAPHGAVIVVQEAFGVNSHIEDVTRRFAGLGYQAVAPHLFHRTGAPAMGYDDFGQVVEHMMALRDDQILDDIDAVIDHLHQSGWKDDQIAIVGFCMGGRVTFLVAGQRSLGAAVGFYGGGIVNARWESMPALIELAPRLQTPWLGLYGDQDGSIPVEDVEQLRTAIAGSPVEAEIVRYPEAEHGFHCDARSAYHPESARDAWGRTLDWFARHLSA